MSFPDAVVVLVTTHPLLPSLHPSNAVHDLSALSPSAHPLMRAVCGRGHVFLLFTHTYASFSNAMQSDLRRIIGRYCYCPAGVCSRACLPLQLGKQAVLGLRCTSVFVCAAGSAQTCRCFSCCFCGCVSTQREALRQRGGVLYSVADEAITHTKKKCCAVDAASKTGHTLQQRLVSAFTAKYTLL